MRYVTLLIVLINLAACAPKTLWAPGPGQTSADFEPAKGRCSMMARHSGGSFAAYGSPDYVAGAALGNAIAENQRSQADFSDCMRASGWTLVTPETVAANSVKKAQYKGIVDQRKECVRGVRNDPRFVDLSPHWSNLDTGGYTVAQLVDEHRPTQIEATELAAYWDALKVCSNVAIAGFTQLDPRLGSLHAQLMSDNEAVIIMLVKRQISWGEADQRQKANGETSLAKAREQHL